ncbi:hypothetical protein CANMA_000643 [Candida margitis]|uniref:uncharacterized protein n=1 Tax=Candida margitis TaxID=1775924 RepID=UPI00222624B6|nr:uncharacterized protein CANMA_000643 [Candida margitis]KAI5970291.1 hypothetical protein CANMA_000643 [Candida margitis]
MSKPQMTVDKEAQYDRQLRLWATSGQSNLENSHIALINASATGCEVLKNLILPGIGKYTIIDDRIVTHEDLSSNFFLKLKDLDKKLAHCVKTNLNELNGDVTGFAIEKSLQEILDYDTDYKFWDQFHCVIVSNYTPKLDTLIDLLWNKRIPLLVVNTVGFYGSLNLIANESTVIETHDPSKLFDLRIDKPWPELQQYADSFRMDELNDQDHAHVPYIVIFIKALQFWKTTHNGEPPSTYNEKKSFKNLIESMSRNINLETNFIEALQSCHRAFQKTELPQSIKSLVESIDSRPITAQTSIFWIYIAALREFLLLNNNILPLPGKLPDMASDSKNYTMLSRLYRDKAIKDQELFTNQVYKILDQVGKPRDSITSESIATFCKNTQLLFVTSGSKNLIADSLLSSLNSSCQLMEGSNSIETDMISIYVGILTFNAYIEEYKTPPTIDDLVEFISIYQSKILKSNSSSNNDNNNNSSSSSKNSKNNKNKNSSSNSSNSSAESPFSPTHSTPQIQSSTLDIFKEILIHNSTNYPNLSSLMGGVASQEILKLTTAQYIPLDNLFVFDGIKSSSERFKIQ